MICLHLFRSLRLPSLSHSPTSWQSAFCCCCYCASRSIEHTGICLTHTRTRSHGHGTDYRFSNGGLCVRVYFHFAYFKALWGVGKGCSYAFHYAAVSYLTSINCYSLFLILSRLNIAQHAQLSLSGSQEKKWSTKKWVTHSWFWLSEKTNSTLLANIYKLIFTFFLLCMLLAINLTQFEWVCSLIWVLRPGSSRICTHTENSIVKLQGFEGGGSSAAGTLYASRYIGYRSIDDNR